MGIFSFLKKSKTPPCDKAVTAIVLASGGSTRMGGASNKVLIEVGGKPLLAYCLEAFQRATAIGSIIIVTRSEDMVAISDIVNDFGFDKVSVIVRGGDTRAQSVRCGLDELPVGTKYIAIHDGARPFVTFEKINAVVSAAKSVGGAILAVPAVDTLKRVKDGAVFGTLERAEVYHAQTPQVFDAEKYFAALAVAGDNEYTDDSAYFENAGFPVAVVEGSYDNFKITYQSDLARARGITEVNFND